MKKFKKIYIEITNRCNLSCSFCHRTRRPKVFMSPAAFAEILGQLEGHTEYLCLHVLGEPLLHPDLALLLNICQAHGMQVNLSTNGFLLNENRATLLTSPALRQINISLHSFAQTAAGPTLDSYLDEVLDFIRQARAATPLLICLRLWNMHADDDSAGLERNSRILERLASFFGLPVRLQGALTAGHGTTLAPGVFLSQALQFTWPHAPGPDLGSRGTCRGLRDHVAILADGTVVPCCLDAEADINLGNIHYLPFAEILAGPRASRLRQGFSRQQFVEPLCRRCTYRQRFLANKGAGKKNGWSPEGCW